MHSIPKFAVKPQFPICSFCNEPVELETSKADENGESDSGGMLRVQSEPTQAPTPRGHS